MSCSTAALLIMSVSRCEMSWGVSTSVAKWGETRLIKRSEELRLSPSRLFERCKYKQFAGTVQIFEEKRPFCTLLSALIDAFRRIGGFFSSAEGFSPRLSLALCARLRKVSAKGGGRLFPCDANHVGLVVDFHFSQSAEHRLAEEERRVLTVGDGGAHVVERHAAEGHRAQAHARALHHIARGGDIGAAADHVGGFEIAVLEHKQRFDRRERHVRGTRVKNKVKGQPIDGARHLRDAARAGEGDFRNAVFCGGRRRSGGLFRGGCRCGGGGCAALCALCGARVEAFALSGEVGFPRLEILLDQSIEVGIVA